MLYYTRGRISGMLFYAREIKIPIVPIVVNGNKKKKFMLLYYCFITYI